MSSSEDPGYLSDKENEPKSPNSRALHIKSRRLVASRNFPRGILRNFSARNSSSRLKRVYGAEFKEKPRRRESSPQKVSSPILPDVSDGESTVKHTASQRPNLQSAMSYWLEQHQCGTTEEDMEGSGSACLEVVDYKHVQWSSDNPPSLDGTVNLGDVRMRSDDSSNDPDTEEFSTPAVSDGPHSDAQMASPPYESHRPKAQYRHHDYRDTADDASSINSGECANERDAGSIASDYGSADSPLRDMMTEGHESRDFRAYKLDADPDRRLSAVSAICDQLQTTLVPGSLFATNSHHAQRATHILLVPRVYVSGAGLIGFISSPTPDTGTWDKLEPTVQNDAALVRLFTRLACSDYISQVEDFAGEENSSDCPVRQCIQWQLEDVDSHLSSSEARPVIVPTHPMVRCLFS